VHTVDQDVLNKLYLKAFAGLISLFDYGSSWYVTNEIYGNLNREAGTDLPPLIIELINSWVRAQNQLTLERGVQERNLGSW